MTWTRERERNIKWKIATTTTNNNNACYIKAQQQMVMGLFVRTTYTTVVCGVTKLSKQWWVGEAAKWAEKHIK